MSYPRRKPTLDLVKVQAGRVCAVADTRALLTELHADVVVGFGGGGRAGPISPHAGQRFRL